jgi:nitrite reductase/ring-hydroxylating ferredoxin subunit
MVEVLPFVSMTTTDRSLSEAVAHLDDLAVGSMKMVKVNGHRVCLVRTSEGVFALDNACPHQGYGLTQGDLTGGLLTCEWHNWKFRVSDGACVVGEENVQTHDVQVEQDGSVFVAIRKRSAEERKPELFASLRRGIERDYVGQIARDTIRLLRASANPGELVWEAVAWGAPRAEFGWGHAIASATDCLTALDLFDGDDCALPIVQAIAGITETERDRPVNPLPDPLSTLPANAAAEFRARVEAEQTTEAQSLVLAAIEAGLGADDLRPWFTSVVSDHHLSYGHGAIYVHKAFQLLDHIGWGRSMTVLPYLVPTLTYGTREDKLPYMRPFMKALRQVDLSNLASRSPDASWQGRDDLVTTLLASDKRAPLAAAITALEEGAGIDGVLDAVALAVSQRMLRYDTAGERDLSDDFGWLDITHGLTYANAVRWHAVHRPGPDTLRLALFTCFLAHYTGRHEWHTTVGSQHDVDRPSGQTNGYGEAAVRASMLDTSGAFIVQAHSIKTSRAAWEESSRLGSLAPLDAAWRFMHAPRQDRFVASAVQQSIDFLSGRVPRD